MLTSKWRGSFMNFWKCKQAETFVRKIIILGCQIMKMLGTESKCQRNWMGGRKETGGNIKKIGTENRFNPGARHPLTSTRKDLEEHWESAIFFPAQKVRPKENTILSQTGTQIWLNTCLSSNISRSWIYKWSCCCNFFFKGIIFCVSSPPPTWQLKSIIESAVKGRGGGLDENLWTPKTHFDAVVWLKDKINKWNEPE